MRFGKKELLLSYMIVAFIFFSIFYFDIKILQPAFLLILIFFFPGVLFTLTLGKLEILKTILYSIVSSISIVLFATIFLNAIVKIPFSSNFLQILLLVTTLPQLVFILFNKKFQLVLPELSANKWLVATLIFAIIAESLLFLKIGSLMGPDVGRFASVSHIYFIEKNIVENLQPYDLAYKHFYFPGVTVLPTLFEITGIDSITGLTLIGLFMNLATILAFYFFSRELLGDHAIHATIFFAFLFNIPLYFILFAFQPFGMNYLFLFTCLAILLTSYFNKSEKNSVVFALSFLGILFFHSYIIFLFVTFIVAIFIYDFVENGRKLANFRRMIFFVAVPAVISLILFSPYLYYFRNSLGVSFTRINKIDIQSYRPLALFSFVNSDIAQRILTVFFSLPVGFVDPIYLIIAFAIFVISWKKFVQGQKKILAIFFILTLGLNYFAESNINLSRFLTSTSIFYPNAMTAMLNYMPLNMLFVGSTVFFNSPSVLFYLKNLEPIFSQGSTTKTIVWPEANDAFSFISKNTSANSTFLIDGGGAGCLGVSSSYGERIFPLTSRKIFYFTNYCWAEYNRTDYSERVDAYRRIAENPSDPSSIQTIKNYGITHIYIGPTDVALKPELFLNSSNYKMIFHENTTYIFQLN